MKITRKKLFESADSVDVDNTQEVVTAAQDAMDIDKKEAEQVTKNIQQVADEVNADTAVILDTKDPYTSTSCVRSLLDDAYEANMLYLKMREEGEPGNNVANVLICGLPGAAKTATIEQWTKEHNLVLVAVSSTSEKLDQAINGLPAVTTDTESGETTLKTVYSNDIVKELLDTKNNRHRCVLFVDEFNRQSDPSLRRPLMSLFNEKRNATGTMDYSETLLFTVVAINPSGMPDDPGAGELSSAELDRFAYKNYDVSSKADDTLQYFCALCSNALLRCGVTPPTEITKDLIVKAGKTVKPANDGVPIPEKKWYLDNALERFDLAHTILTNPKFRKNNQGVEQGFDTIATAKDIIAARKMAKIKGDSGENAAILTARGLAQMIAANPSVSSFLKYVDSSACGWSSRVKALLHSILDGHVFNKDEWYKKCGIGGAVKHPARANGGQIARPSKISAFVDDGQDAPHDSAKFGQSAAETILQKLGAGIGALE